MVPYLTQLLTTTSTKVRGKMFKSVWEYEHFKTGWISQHQVLHSTLEVYITAKIYKKTCSLGWSGLLKKQDTVTWVAAA